MLCCLMGYVTGNGPDDAGGESKRLRHCTSGFAMFPLSQVGTTGGESLFLQPSRSVVKPFHRVCRANQFFKVEILLGRQLYCRPQEMPAIQGWQCNCHPNTAEN
jgi:hypothetical protein